MKLSIIKLNIPINFNLILIKNSNKLYIIMFNKDFIFKKYIYNKSILKINKSMNYLEYKNYYLQNNFYILNNYYFKFFEKLNNYYFVKIKFKGKGYKIGFYKKKKFINFFFGKSHKSIFIYNNLIIRKLTKYKFIILKNNLDSLIKTSNGTINIKSTNPYTNRGLRSSRQLIIKRKGRKGSFV